MIKKYVYKGKTYTSVYELRQVIWKTEARAFGNPTTAEAWAKLGVTYTEEEDSLDDLKARKLQELNFKWENAKRNTGSFKSSLGFTARGRVEDGLNYLVARDLLNGSAKGQATFITDVNQQVHGLELPQVETLLTEFAEHGVLSHAAEVRFREAINAAKSKADLENIKIDFPTTTPAIPSTFRYPSQQDGHGMHWETSGNQAEDNVTGVLWRTPYIKFGVPQLGNLPIDLILPSSAVSYYATLMEEEEAVPKRTATLWFDDNKTSESAYFQADRASKSYQIEETDNKDPNDTGGSAFRICYVVDMEGVAPTDGTVKIWVEGLDQLKKSTGVALDESGDPMEVGRTYKQGQKLGLLVIERYVEAKNIRFLRFKVDNPFDDPLLIKDHVQGKTCMLIEEVSDKSRIGIGGIQYEIDTGFSLKDVRKYFGAESFTTSWITQEDVPVSLGQAGEAYTLASGVGLNNLTSLKTGVEGGYLKFLDDGTNIADFDFHKIFNRESTFLKRGKEVKVTFEGKTPSGAFRVYLMKYTGLDKAPTKILAGRNNGSPIWTSGWTAVDNFFIQEEIDNVDHTVSKNFTVPSDADQYAYVIIPEDRQNPCTLWLKLLQEDVVAPFRTHYYLNPPVEEDRYFFKNELLRFIQDNEGYGRLRYTVNDGWLPCPVGIAKDSSDISLDTKVNTIAGSSAKGGEGALVFPNGGTAQITVTFRVLNEQATDSEFSARLVFFDADGKASPIADAGVVVRIPAKSAGSMVVMKSGDITVRAKDRIGVQFKSDKKDGCYLESTSPHEPLVYTLLRFEEVSK